jgi:hypothetical protein
VCWLLLSWGVGCSVLAAPQLGSECAATMCFVLSWGVSCSVLAPQLGRGPQSLLVSGPLCAGSSAALGVGCSVLCPQLEWGASGLPVAGSSVGESGLQCASSSVGEQAGRQLLASRLGTGLQYAGSSAWDWASVCLLLS